MSPSNISSDDKLFVQSRAHFCCEYCWSQEKYSPTSFSIEHIAPQSQGGSHHVDNLAYACQGCNNFKYTHTMAYDPVTGRQVMLYNPRQHVWSSHFKWSEDYSLLVGVTAIGRATISKLKLNRTNLVNLRKLLVTVEEHPPISE
ncbi:MAG TPA: HNH endonuclease [Anaerolineae bacterium]|nr:HNH endonuclease [Anaerolineae bacterium]